MSDVRHSCSSQAYDDAYLGGANAADLAWEWLRRDVAYRKLVPSASTDGPFGCQLFPLASDEVKWHWGSLNVASADRAAEATQLLWSAEVDRSVLSVAALPARTPVEVAFDLARWGSRVTIVQGAYCEHVLVRTRHGQFRFDVCDGTILQEPVRLFAEVAIGDTAAMSAARFDRFRNALLDDRAGGFAPRRDRAHHRQIAALRTFDALTEGASIRDVAITLFGETRVQAEWLDPSEALKSASRRLIALARRMGSGGYRSLLHTAGKRLMM